MNLSVFFVLISIIELSKFENTYLLSFVMFSECLIRPMEQYLRFRINIFLLHGSDVNIKRVAY